MSMFSTHYLIRNNRDGGYWNGRGPAMSDAWTIGDSINAHKDTAIRFHTRVSAERVIVGLGMPDYCSIEEDE